MTEKLCPKCQMIVDENHRHDDTRTKHRHPSRWYKVTRPLFISEFPLCADCLADGGKVVPAKDVHHIVKPHTGATVSERMRLTYSKSNMMSLCKYHHGVRTKRGE